jgi:hypothetical protein
VLHKPIQLVAIMRGFQSSGPNCNRSFIDFLTDFE